MFGFLSLAGLEKCNCLTHLRFSVAGRPGKCNCLTHVWFSVAGRPGTCNVLTHFGFSVASRPVKGRALNPKGPYGALKGSPGGKKCFGAVGPFWVFLGGLKNDEICNI